MRVLMWFRADLRVQDNTALSEACRDADDGVVAVFQICPKQWKDAHDWADIKVDFILRNLHELKAALADRNIPLLVQNFATFDEAPKHLLKLAEKHDCQALYFNREYEVNERERDEAVRDVFESSDREVHAFHDQTIVPPTMLRTNNDTYYTVFTPYKNSWVDYIQGAGVPEPKSRPRKQKQLSIAADDIPKSVQGFKRQDDWAERWPAGEDHARSKLDWFIENHLDKYHDQRDRPDLDNTSQISPYLTCGVISARRCLHEARTANNDRLTSGKKGPSTWISELIWREFYRHILVGFPRVSMHRPFRLETEKLDWNDNDEHFEAWCAGRTGVPIVDAAMRQLNTTGWMHNRLRMIVAMFLTKDLYLDWRLGERYFMRHLIDGDLASNNGGWQWSASTGTDAAPYFRIFNPFTQSKRFDPDGSFIRKYVPELAELDNDDIHEPHKLPELLRSDIDYPAPIVDHSEARKHAIEAFKALK